MAGSVSRWIAVVVFLFWGLAATSAQAQDEEFIPDEDEATAPETDFAAIDDLLKMDEEVLSDPATYSYDPGSRRDPFRSLNRTSRKRRSGKRPEGAAGLLIDEISLQGVFVLGDGPVVQVQSASQRTSFLLRVGDQLWDGDVIRISLREVVFKQSVNDPTALKPFREIVKRLR